jgi:hypothetical protein
MRKARKLMTSSSGIDQAMRLKKYTAFMIYDL